MMVMCDFLSPGLEDHASKRQKVDDATAEEILMRISNGDISDGDFSDDELEAENEENIPANGQVTASTTTAALPARPDATVSSNAPAASTKAEFKWVKKDFAPSDVDCHYNPEVASTCQQPLVYFSKYFTEQIFEDLAEFTNRYVLQRDGAVLATTKEEIKIFFGMLMLMGVLKYPRVRMYWQTATRIPAIADSMGVKRFFKIRGALHISDANEERDPNSQDKFWKVRPLLEAVRSRCLQLVPLEQNSIDEQMVPFTGRIAAKQFVKGKPNPEGVKVFVRCSFDGLAHDFEFYQGKGTGVSKEHAHLGLGGSVVMRLVESLPKAQNIKCYMDNYFTSVKLFLELKKIGILASGTIRGNRLAGCVMKTDKEMKKEGRGSYDERVSQNDEVVLVRWQDNGTVNMASTHLGVGNIGTEEAKCPDWITVASKKKKLAERVACTANAPTSVTGSGKDGSHTAASQNVLRHIVQASRIPNLPWDHFKTILPPRGQMHVKKTDLLIFKCSLAKVASLAAEQVFNETPCTTPF
ncbi:hypothetical protein HPB51_005825 [Rhipicephalus microplus]|uniref:PiggyBac transposable element-derived protein domain-containing protein n=1 Tax=Rhipicephalus microplus TaxID=6941 RepID=A0A9J6D8I1_RHIMP|nr:hypothetical protein HPB51_005825 [Rhipicephalus microplus]